LKTGSFEIAAANCEMDVLEPADGFKFNNNFSFDEEVQTVLADLMIAIKEWYCVLADELDSTECKFNS